MLNGRTLKREAAAACGQADFGPDPFAENLERLVEAINSDARLSPEGIAATHAELVHHLTNRIEVEQWLAREPRILEEPISRPIFVTGLPRSGTTFLLNMFRDNENLRPIYHWEARKPCPPPATDPASVAQRISDARRDLEYFERQVEKFSALHLVDADGPDECTVVLSQTMAMVGFHNYLNVPGYFKWALASLDFDAAYRFHKRLLQLLQWQQAPRRWILKYPNHLLALDVIGRIHPDSCLVITHRDPVQTLASLCDLTYELRCARSPDCDPHEVGQQMLDFVVHHIARLMSYRPESGRIVINIDYYAMVADPVGTVKGICAGLGVPISTTALAALESWVEANPKGKRGAHDYGLERFGLEVDAVEPAFASYRSRYSIPREMAR